jgi:hypothetical protein
MTGLGEPFLGLVAVSLPMAGVMLRVLLVGGTQQKTDVVRSLSVENGPTCGTALPAVRVPGILREGGWTCAPCGAELDTRGRPLDR